MAEGAHRWAMVLVLGLAEDDAEVLGRADVFGRLDRVAELVERGKVRAARILCEDCRVSWEDVHHDASPFPCQGVRPAPLGGPLAAPPERLPRQQRRAAQRAAAKSNERPKAPVRILPRGVHRVDPNEAVSSAVSQEA